MVKRLISDNYVTGDNVYLRELQNFFFECLGMMSITHYGAVGDGRVDNYGPLQVAIDDAHRRGLSFLYVPYGRFIYTGELQNIGDLIFMGNPHAHIVNIRTGEEIEIHQFGWNENTSYTREEADGRFVKLAGDTMTGSLAIGGSNTVSDENNNITFAQGVRNQATGYCASATGYENVASYNHSHAEGYRCVSDSFASHAEGRLTEASSSGGGPHAEGNKTKATGYASHAEGDTTRAGGQASHAEGNATISSGNQSHAEGYNTTASGDQSHAEGHSTTASGNQSHAEGYNSQAIYRFCHAEGGGTLASGYAAHAEGYSTEATEYATHTEGYYTQATRQGAHAGGYRSRAVGFYSFAHGHSAEATKLGQYAIGVGNINEGEGQYANITSTDGLFIVGNGTRNVSEGTIATRSNALKLTFAGDLYIAGTLHSNGADYAECVEWVDGNPNGEDRVGKFVTLENNKMRIANSQDAKELLGVISAFPSVLGDSFDSYWHGKYVTDVYGRIQYETVTIPAHTEGETTIPETTETRPIISPDYDPEQTYIPRNRRKEYGAFAMLGKLIVEDDGTCVVGGYCYPNDNGIGTAKQEGFYVLERIDSTHVKIFVR